MSGNPSENNTSACRRSLAQGEHQADVPRDDPTIIQHPDGDLIAFREADGTGVIRPVSWLLEGLRIRNGLTSGNLEDSAQGFSGPDYSCWRWPSIG